MGYKHPDAIINRCPSCDHCFSDPNSIQDPETYGKEYFCCDHKNWFDKPNLALFKKISIIISKFKVNASVIDIGCGKGDFLFYLRSKNENLVLTGVDLYDNSSTDSITFIRKDFLSWEDSDTYDVIVSLSVIEHLCDIKEFINKVKEMAAKNNLIVISTINERSFLYDVARFTYRLGLKMPFVRLYGKHHINHFNKSSLARLLKLNNIAIKKIINHDVNINAIDLPSPLNKVALVQISRFMIFFIFLIGKLSGKTYLQTIICSAASDSNN